MYNAPETPFLQEQIRLTLKDFEDSYAPGDSVHDAVSNKSFTGIIGPFGVGKSTLVEAALQIEPQLKAIHTTTTRGRKPEDPAHFRTADEGVTFSTFRDAVADRSLVNYSVIPGADIYGTFPEDFPDTYSIGPFLPQSMHHIEQAGFKNYRFIYIVSPGELWRGYVEKSRRNMSPDRFLARAYEAAISLQFAKDNQDRLTFIENIDGPAGIATTAQKIARLSLFQANEALDTEKANQYLNEMLAVARELASA